MNLCAHITVQIRKYKSTWCNFHPAAFASSFVLSVSLPQEREGTWRREEKTPISHGVGIQGKDCRGKALSLWPKEIWHRFINMLFSCGVTWGKPVWKRWLMNLSPCLLPRRQVYGLHTGPLMQIRLCSPLEVYTQRMLHNLKLTKAT